MIIKRFLQIWSHINYSDGLPSRIDLDENTTAFTIRFFDHVLHNPQMKGYSIMGLPVVAEAEEDNRITLKDIFDELYTGNFFSPSYYLYKIAENGLNLQIEDEHFIFGYMCRGLRTFASFIREIDLAEKINQLIPECTVDMNPTLDIMSHIDIMITYHDTNYGIWSYQNTERGLINGSRRLRGERGAIEDGIYILCPFDENDKETYYGWWLHSAEYVEEVVRIIHDYDNNQECDNYNEITDFTEYMRNIHIFKKGE